VGQVRCELPGAAPEPETNAARCVPSQFHLHGPSVYGIFEVHFNRIIQVLSLLRTALPWCAAAEEIPEKVLEIPAPEEVSARGAPSNPLPGRCWASKTLLESCMAELVILLPLLRVGKDFVGLTYFFKFRFRNLVSGFTSG